MQNIGKLPSSIGLLSGLTGLRVDENALTGSINCKCECNLNAIFFMKEIYLKV